MSQTLFPDEKISAAEFQRLTCHWSPTNRSVRWTIEMREICSRKRRNARDRDKHAAKKLAISEGR